MEIEDCLEMEFLSVYNLFDIMFKDLQLKRLDAMQTSEHHIGDRDSGTIKTRQCTSWMQIKKCLIE